MSGAGSHGATSPGEADRAATQQTTRISVVVPSWRDAENLARLIPALKQLSGIHELIVVDASATEATEQLAMQHGAILLKCSAPNRGAQMNVGAMFASGDILLFQHSDTELTEAHLTAIQRAAHDPQIIGGAFHRKFDERHPWLLWLEGVARLRTRHGGTLYGDQSIFVRRELFLQMGGFAKIPLMEDVEFSQRLRAAGRIAVLDPPVRSSGRHHAQKGAWLTTVQNGLFIVLYKFGVSPVRLHRWYYRRATATAAQPSAPLSS